MPKKKFHIVFKILLVIPLLLFAFWLVRLIYSPEPDEIAEAGKTQQETTVFRKILKQQSNDYRGHFHMIDEYVSLSEPFKPFCVTCHGTYPHSKEPKVRSVLNFHGGFMACAVCHVRREPADKRYSLVWVDRYSGQMSRSVQGEFGKYMAKIFPVIIDDNGREEVFRPVSEKAAADYLKLKDSYSPDQNVKAKTMLHAQISKKPIFCNECHKKDGYFNFARLGFSDNRIKHLTSTEVTGMIDRYETFYLPSVIDFGAGSPLK